MPSLTLLKGVETANLIRYFIEDFFFSVGCNANGVIVRGGRFFGQLFRMGAADNQVCYGARSFERVEA
jgi:hypothetical protein